MGTRWRKAFCTTIPRDSREAITTPEEEQSPSPILNTSKSYAKLGFQSRGSSNPSTPRLRCKTSFNNNTNENIGIYAQTPSAKDDLISPKLLQCKTTPKSYSKSKSFGSTPSSPRSPFSILKKTLRLSRNSCGVCMQSVKTSQGMAIYTAECSHTFHFPCISQRLRSQNSLICPVCNTTWKDVPLLANIHKLQEQTQFDETKHNRVLKSPKITQEKRSFDDDEPLVSPSATASTKFINEEKDAAGEEFQGFFANPIASNRSYLQDKDGRNVEVSVLPEAAVISSSRTHRTYAVVLKVKAPGLLPPPSTHVLDLAQRAPIDLVIVLDVSETMSGAKLRMLKRAVGLLISSLGSVDRLCMITFAASPKRMMPLMRMTAQGQGLARNIIDRLVCSQGSSVCEALKAATKVLDDRRHKNPVASIILLSDGQDDSVQANNTAAASTNKRRESPQFSSTRFAHVELPVRSSGFSPEPAVDAFSKCVSGLLSVVVQDLKIQISFSHGSDPAEISAIYSCHVRPTVMNSSCILVGNLYAEEEREYLVEMRIPIVEFHSHQHHVFSVRCSSKDPATQELIYGGEQSLLVPRPRNNAIGSRSSIIEQPLKYRFIAVRAIGESRRLIEHNEVSSAMQLLSSARALMIQCTSKSTDEFVRELDIELAELQWKQTAMIQPRRVIRREMGLFVDECEEPLTPTSARIAAEKLAKMKNKVCDLHGFENWF